VDSCRTCEACKEDEEQFCGAPVFTYNSTDKDGTRTQGGYSTRITVDEDFVLRIREGQPLDRVARSIQLVGVQEVERVVQGRRVAVISGVVISHR
jgi:D-arabinose 1-dehydrogenase-like Zn-dependent alcohol dehydrogenase